jgi:dihydrofolate synthase/folylpolyglutamate synthase
VKTIKQSQYNKCITVICVLADKDIEGIIKLLVPIVDHWVIVNLNTARASEVRNLQNFISKYSQKEISVGRDASQSMQIADISSQENDLILVTGSFYTVGPSLKWIEKRIDECN